MNKKNLLSRFREELRFAREAEDLNDLDLAFAHLERAHILGQRWFWRHCRTHWSMLRIARRRKDRKEISGQVRRLLAVPLGWGSGWVPKGNTGGANVNPLKPMPIPEDMRDDLAGFSVTKDVAVRVAFLSLAAIAILLLAFVSEVRAANGENLVISADASERCVKVPGMPGAEDIVAEDGQSTGFAIGGDRRSFRAGGPGRGKIFAFDFSDPTRSHELEFAKPSSFRSFGGDLHIDADGTRRLFVANRGEPNHSIEVFRILGNAGEERLIHERTMTAPGFVNPNDVFALSPSSAAVTLDKRSAAGGLAEIWEGARRQPSGRVVHIDADGMRTVAAGLLSSNGIQMSADRHEAYVGELVGRAVSIYRITEDGAWQRKKRVTMPFAVDNLTLRDDGNLLVAGHPKLLTLARGYQHDETSASPSQVALLDPRTGSLETIMQDSGRFFSGSSVGLQNKAGELLVGTAFGRAILRCRTS